MCTADGQSNIIYIHTHVYMYVSIYMDEEHVTVHAKRWYKSAKIFFEITLDFAFIDSSASSLQIWSS